jgi:UDP-N-acetylglucosamine:LPS N-acetylglucosamine transferase
MRLADFFIGKPGPGSMSEALQLGLPALVVRNAWTMPQERYNADWIVEHDVGVVHDSYRTIDVAVSRLVERLDELKANVGRLRNRAVFEVPEILADILHQATGAAAARSGVADGFAADQAALATGVPAA